MSFGSRLGDRDRKQTSGEDIVTDEHEENLECLRAQYANQQEVCVCVCVCMCVHAGAVEADIRE